MNATQAQQLAHALKLQAHSQISGSKEEIITAMVKAYWIIIVNYFTGNTVNQQPLPTRGGYPFVAAKRQFIFPRDLR